MSTLATQQSAPAANTRDLNVKDLGELLNALRRFGNVTLCTMEKGWWCYIQVHVSAIGAALKVESDTKNATPLAAAQQCAERLVQVVKQWEGK